MRRLSRRFLTLALARFYQAEDWEKRDHRSVGRGTAGTLERSRTALSFLPIPQPMRIIQTGFAAKGKGRIGFATKTPLAARHHRKRQ
jgi:hypothetical protein